LIRIFEGVGNTDEHFFQTVIANSPFRDRLGRVDSEPVLGVHYIDWHRGSPKVLGVEDFERLIASPALFARQFETTEDSAILDMIDVHLMRRAGGDVQHRVGACPNTDTPVGQSTGEPHEIIARVLRTLARSVIKKKQKGERKD
jgi:hypothetical protein